MTAEDQLGLAEAQLLGYGHHRAGYGLTELVDAMGLSLAEWEQLQSDYVMPYLDDDDRATITRHLRSEAVV
ncbi:hypothetical protein [Cardiobacterium valvarum]|uniref:Uncharacterized protein n=1 Tax=Cardiobacterium valvarum TaxID=194702 RepID=A0A381E3L6_9GAMM|nr:hypothetical protein [Cardiobacterium valvarum]SUX20845.1 Uncharacterised protein [Cardiobacterium valvarum]DAM37627.1 MAG TPA: hypothetical protein [Caudoviricetes sp.]